MAGSLGTLEMLPPECRYIIWQQFFDSAAIEARANAADDTGDCRTRTALLRASKDLHADSIVAFHTALYRGMEIELVSRRVITGAPSRADYIIEHNKRTNAVSSRRVPDPTGEYYDLVFTANCMRRPMRRPLGKREMRHVQFLRVIYSNPTSSNATGTREWDPDSLYVLQDDPEDPTPTWDTYVQGFNHLQGLQLYMLHSRNVGLGDERSVQLLLDTTNKIARPLLTRNSNVRKVTATSQPGCLNEVCAAAVRQALSALASSHRRKGCRYYHRTGEWPYTADSYTEIIPERPNKGLSNVGTEKDPEMSSPHPTAPLYVQWKQVVLPYHHEPNPIWVRP